MDGFEILIDLAENKGFRFIPLSDDRTPSFKGWQDKATSDKFTLKKWAKNYRNWGLVTGRDSGVFVIDLDVKNEAGNGVRVWKRLLKENRTSDPDTVKVRTPSGGVHVYYQYPKKYKLGNSISKIGPGIDTRGEGGFVVVPPSYYGPDHPELQYAWKTDPQTSLPDLPKWLLDLLIQANKEPQTTLEGKIPRGQRNVTLFKQAAKFRRSGMDQEEILAMLKIINNSRCEPPLASSELAKIAGSVQQYEPSDPMVRVIERTGDDSEVIFSQGEYSPTDVGNAHRMAELYGGEFYYVAEWKRWAAWNGKVWDTRGGWEFTDAIQKMVETIELEAAFCPDEDRKKRLYGWASTCQNSSRITACENMAPGMIDTFLIKLNSQEGLKFDDTEDTKYLFNCLNGTVNLRTGEIYDHRKEDMLTQMSPTNYNPQAKAPRWEKFLLEIMGGDQEMVDFLQKAIGYSISGDISEQCFFILCGDGRNGKSTFLETVSGVIGPDFAINSPTSMIVQGWGSSIPNDVARLWNKRFTTVNEIENGQKLAEAKVKQMTGGDTITARFMREEYFDFVPRFKLWVRANHKPQILGTDEAMWRRIRLIPFTQTFDPDTPGFDPYLYGKLLAESEGILAWAIEGFRVWQRERLVPVPQKVSAATEHYRQESNDLLAFLGQVCVISQDGSGIKPSDLLEEYNAWAKINQAGMMNYRVLAQRMESLGIVRSKTHGSTYYRLLDFEGQVGDNRPHFELSLYRETAKNLY